MSPASTVVRGGGWAPASKDSHLCWHKIAGGCCVRQHKGVLAASKNHFWPSGGRTVGQGRVAPMPVGAGAVIFFQSRGREVGGGRHGAARGGGVACCPVEPARGAGPFFPHTLPGEPASSTRGRGIFPENLIQCTQGRTSSPSAFVGTRGTIFYVLCFFAPFFCEGFPHYSKLLAQI
jgi:hypothetical protein